MPKQQFIATWNRARGVWETDQQNLLCAHLEAYSEVWPPWGIVRNGIAYGQQTPAQPITVTGSSLLPTPTVSDTFTAGLKSTQQSHGSLHSVSLAQIVNRDDLLPTPTLGHLRNYDEPVQDYLDRKAKGTSGEYRGIPGISLGVAVRINWGRFAPAIEKWAKVIGRPAPAATKPDPENKNQILSEVFTEWLMGLPHGWVTEVGLSRKEALKACGNGVVPQQAELALRILLENTKIEGINK